MRLLLAEDEKELSNALVVILKHSNYSVDAVYNGQDALDYITNGDYDGVVLDIMMPKMNGLDATVMIRQLAREDAKKVIIIAMTANAYTEDVDKSMAAGMNAHLSKPVDTERMFRVIGEFIRP